MHGQHHRWEQIRASDQQSSGITYSGNIWHCGHNFVGGRIPHKHPSFPDEFPWEIPNTYLSFRGTWGTESQNPRSTRELPASKLRIDCQKIRCLQTVCSRCLNHQDLSRSFGTTPQFGRLIDEIIIFPIFGSIISILFPSSLRVHSRIAQAWGVGRVWHAKDHHLHYTPGHWGAGELASSKELCHWVIYAMNEYFMDIEPKRMFFFWGVILDISWKVFENPLGIKRG